MFQALPRGHQRVGSKLSPIQSRLKHTFAKSFICHVKENTKSPIEISPHKKKTVTSAQKSGLEYGTHLTPQLFEKSNRLLVANDKEVLDSGLRSQT
jgi:hypothetical protein